jgi:hypothetical protein
MGKPLSLRYVNAEPRGYKRFGVVHLPCGARCSDPEGDSPNGVPALDRKTAEFREAVVGCRQQSLSRSRDRSESPLFVRGARLETRDS